MDLGRSSNGQPLESPSSVQLRLEEERFIPLIADDIDTLPRDVYKTTTVANTLNGNATNNGRRKYSKLLDIYSESKDTVEFTRNMTRLFDSLIPNCLWICTFVFFCILALVMIIIGGLNLLFGVCRVNGMIPVFLFVLGLCYLTFFTIRIYFCLSVSQQLQRRGKSLSASILSKGAQMFLLLFMFVWFILGCVWVYGSRAEVHFERHMFEPHYCDKLLYDFAWWLVTVHLVLIAVIIILLIGLIGVGICKYQGDQSTIQ